MYIVLQKIMSSYNAFGGTVATGVDIITSSVGAVVAITWDILLGAGCKKLKNTVLAVSGAGVALIF